jgi:hypothetical protein
MELLPDCVYHWQVEVMPVVLDRSHERGLFIIGLPQSLHRLLITTVQTLLLLPPYKISHMEVSSWHSVFVVTLAL